MNQTSTTKKRKVKDAFFQVSESFFEKEEILDIMSHYEFQGIGIYLKISLMLLKNQGKMKYDWKYISTKKSEKKIIEEIIIHSGLFTISADGLSFSSSIVDEQLTERGKISMAQSKRVSKRWDKNQISTTENNNTNIVDGENIKPKQKTLTAEEIEELNRIDGIKTKPTRKWEQDEDQEFDA